MLELNLQRAVLKDRYEIRGRISSGSYAEVFVARDRDSGNAVVIKALNTIFRELLIRNLSKCSPRSFRAKARSLTKFVTQT
jgi:serine/threonine protein kinase